MKYFKMVVEFGSFTVTAFSALYPEISIDIVAGTHEEFSCKEKLTLEELKRIPCI